MSKKYRLISAKDMFTFRNLIIEWNGWVYNIVYGKSEDGYFLAIPNHHFSCLISEPSDIEYNKDKIERECRSKEEALVIATVIKEDSE